ncbi:hypothetical protein AB5J62_36020 [Amycolatopsis sp. cg5]|uniref:hypothetical protein n=1 Tax=Amycolatopsis sp. cg5 TaxID=3238802 RepID=UPI0035241AF1
MEDIDFRTALQDYVSREEAPSTLAEDKIVSASKKSRRLRRYAAVGSVTAVVAAIGGGLSLLPDRNAPPEPAAAGSCAGTIVDQYASDLTSRMQCVLAKAIRAELKPDAELAAPHPNEPWTYVLSLDDPSRYVLRRTGEDDVTLRFTVTDSKGAGSVVIRFTRNTAGALGSCPAQPDDLVCTTKPGPNGGQLRETVQNKGALVTDRVEFHTRDSIVEVVSQNYPDPTYPGRTTETDKPTRPTPVLDMAQLERIATNPGIVR